MKQKLFFLVFFSVFLIGLSSHAGQICCYNNSTREECLKDKDKDDCQETTCGQNMIFNHDPEVCKCECAGVQSCDENYIWDQEKCDCICQEQVCDENKVFDKLACDCICQKQSCESNKTFDDQKCECVCNEMSCEGGKVQNKDICNCECPEGQTEVSNGQCCLLENVAIGYNNIMTCCVPKYGFAQGTPQCCRKMGGNWLSRTNDSVSEGRCCPPNETAFDSNGQFSCCSNCCAKDDNGNPTPWSSGVKGTPSTNRVSPSCCELLGGTFVGAEGGLFFSGYCCKGAKNISHGNILTESCCEMAGGRIKKVDGVEKCCKCGSKGC